MDHTDRSEDSKRPRTLQKHILTALELIALMELLAKPPLPEAGPNQEGYGTFETGRRKDGLDRL
ncbi:MAG: hypothetical protein P8175_15480 [Deltaproteobacteria bacterium]